jgi:dienelactone hydrolase
MTIRIAASLGLALIVAAGACKKDEDKAAPAQPEGKATPAGDSKQPPATPPDEKPPTSVKGEEIEYKAGDVTLKGYLAYDESIKDPRPGVLVVHEWWGHNDYARRRATMLAELGYTALAVDMYGDGKQAAHPDDAQKFMKEVIGNMDEGVKRFEAAKKLLEEHESTAPDKTAAIGYCFGGAVVLHMARVGMDLDGVASFHGSLASPTVAKKGEVKAKVLVMHGEADPFVKPEDVDGFKKEMAAAEADMKFIGYPGAKHAFTNPAATENGKKFELPLEYNAEADKKSWAELETFLGALFN